MSWSASIQRYFKTEWLSLGALFCLLFFSQLVLLPAKGWAQQMAQLDPDYELIVDIRLDDRLLGLDILGYQHNDHFYLSLAELSDALRFPINVNSETGQAEGWFIRPERTLVVEPHQHRAIISGQATPFQAEQVGLTPDGLFVRSDLLETWFPLRITPYIRELGIHIETRELLPIQAQWQRAERESISSDNSNSVQYEVVPDPYRLFGHRTNQFRFTQVSTQQNEDAQVNSSSSYALMSKGDLAWMTSTLNVTGRDDKVTMARLNFQRTRFKGPLGLQHFELGDVNSQSGGGGGLGVLFRGGSVDERIERNFSADTVDINGDRLPGWDVELYRNGVLIASQTVGEAGRYNFDNVDLVFGENNFRLIFYGPFGEVEEEERLFFTTENSIGRGQVRYEFAATQQDRTLLGVGDADRLESGSPDYTANLGLGVTRNIALNLGVRSYERNEERLLDYNIGSQIRLPFAQTRFNYRHQDTSYNTYQGSLLTRLGGLGVSLDYAHYDYSDYDQSTLPDNQRRWSSSLGLTHKLGDMPMNFNLNHSDGTQRSLTNALFDTQISLGEYRINKSFFYQYEEIQEPFFDSNEYIGGSLASTFAPAPWHIRLGFSYDIKPEFELTQLNASSRLRIDDSMTMTFDVQRRLYDSLTTYTAGINWRLKWFVLSPRISYDSEGRYMGLLTFTTNFATRPGSQPLYFDSLPMASHGGVYGRVYESGLTSEQLRHVTPIEQAELHAVQAYRKATSNKAGEVYLNRLSAWRPTDIELERSSLINPAHIPQQEGYAVIPRPGHWQQLDFAHFIGTELEGKAFIQDEGGFLEPAARLLVILTTERGVEVSRQRTLYDGSYVLSDIEAGRYLVQLQDGLNERVVAQPSVIVVPGDGEIVYLEDLILAKGKKPESGIIQTAPMTSIVSAAEAQSPVQVEAQKVQQTPTQLGGWGVQLGAFSERANAERLWQETRMAIQTIYPAASPLYIQTGQLTRLLVQPGVTKLEADNLCLKLQEQQINCLLRQLPK